MEFIVLELLTGEKLKCTGCDKMVEAEKVYIHFERGLEPKEEVEEVFCEKCHDDR